MKQAKFIAVLILAVLCLIIVLQNTATVETKILFITITMPRAILLLTTTAIGFALGVLVSLIVCKKQRSNEE
ncbi:MAG: lipopolysaccharide assembly protein LapA domain-containing protein [bacterium]